MHVQDFSACRELYGAELGLEEIAHGTDADGHQVCMFAVGPSVLELHEDPNAVSARLPSGQPKDSSDIPGSVRHFAFLVASNDEAYAVLKESKVPLSTKEGPQLQPIDHAYMQRSLLEFKDPNDFIVQIAEVVDPRSHLQSRRALKGAAQMESRRSGMFMGFDHFNMGCKDIRLTKEFYCQKLRMEELSTRTIEGVEENVFAVGVTDLEMYALTAPHIPAYGPGIVRSLGFWTDDVDKAYQTLKDAGVAVGVPPSELTPLPGVRKCAFAFLSPDGLPLELAQRL